MPDDTKQTDESVSAAVAATDAGPHGDTGPGNSEPVAADRPAPRVIIHPYEFGQTLKEQRIDATSSPAVAPSDAGPAAGGEGDAAGDGVRGGVLGDAVPDAVGGSEPSPVNPTHVQLGAYVLAQDVTIPVLVVTYDKNGTPVAACTHGDVVGKDLLDVAEVALGGLGGEDGK